jgi:hypothetical protein
VRHIDVFQTFAAALNTLAASAGGEQGLMQLLQSSGQGSAAAAAAGGAALASSSNATQVRVVGIEGGWSRQGGQEACKGAVRWSRGLK